MIGEARAISVKYVGGRPKTIKVIGTEKPKKKPTIKVSADTQKFMRIRRTLDRHALRLFDVEDELTKMKNRVVRDGNDIDTLYIMVESVRKQNLGITILTMILFVILFVATVVL